MAFERGQRVEIISQEEGFEGSYFPAVIISKVSEDDYIVQYSTLHDGQHEGYQEFRPLREFCKGRELRPTPPPVSVSEFSVKEKVDAYYNDGWWAGEVVNCIDKPLEKKSYLVFFKRFAEELRFEFDDLRVHQDWSNGEWSIPRKAGERTLLLDSLIETRPRPHLESKGFEEFIHRGLTSFDYICMYTKLVFEEITGDGREHVVWKYMLKYLVKISN